MQLSFPSVPTDPTTNASANAAAGDAPDAFGAIFAATGQASAPGGFAKIFGNITSSAADAPVGDDAAGGGVAKKTPAVGVDAQMWSALFATPPAPVEVATPDTPAVAADAFDAAEVLPGEAVGVSTVAELPARGSTGSHVAAPGTVPTNFSAVATPASPLAPVDSPAAFASDEPDPEAPAVERSPVSFDTSAAAADASNRPLPDASRMPRSGLETRTSSDTPSGILVARERVPLEKIAPTAAPVDSSKWLSSPEPDAAEEASLAIESGFEIADVATDATNVDAPVKQQRDSSQSTPGARREPLADLPQPTRTFGYTRAMSVTDTARWRTQDTAPTTDMPADISDVAGESGIRPVFSNGITTAASSTTTPEFAGEPVLADSFEPAVGVTALPTISAKGDATRDVAGGLRSLEGSAESAPVDPSESMPRHDSPVASDIQPVIRLAPQLLRDAAIVAGDNATGLRTTASGGEPQPPSGPGADLAAGSAELTPAVEVSNLAPIADDSAPATEPVDVVARPAVMRHLRGRSADPVTAAPAPAAKIAEAFARSDRQSGSGESFAFKKPLDAKEERVKSSDPSVGTGVAKPDVAMSAAAHSPLKPVVPVHDGAFAVAGGSALQEASALNPATPTEPSSRAAQHAVEAVLSAVERFSSGDRHAVNLAFSIGGSDLHVRVEMRADEVRTAFHTTSPELRAALAQEWQTVASQAGDRGVRFSDPVFSSQPNGGNGHSGAHADGGWQQRESASRREFAESFATFGSGAQSDEEEVAAAAPRSITDRWANSRRLQTFA
jgi:hypothetical protein